MVVRFFNLNDIKMYEINNNVSLLDMLNELTINNLVEFIKLGNNKCSDEDAYRLLDVATESGQGLVDIHAEIRDCLFGRAMEEDETGVDISKFKSATDIFMDIGMNLTSVGMSFNEFWSMTTIEMHKMFKSIITRIKNDTDRELAIGHTMAAMIGQAVWGKLDKEPPKMNISQYDEEDEDSDMDYETLKNLHALNNVASSYKVEDKE